ncbi:uncharacterized protein E0L32_003464 [Thyridium curvatum]|uniref:Carbohydrate-binding domain-containing protein n=1 Tax=Thyridium curvatum TaxID=1093900 RepID=A0A507B3S2_9PEZI|nr:uncharacterized protein E0L32_003464 [Thyridium curvatum]TPX16902.1 hypothetical protein E0L32_003464 [Thyridium curvatum]
MLSKLTIIPALAALATAAALPSVDVPACPSKATVSYDRSMPAPSKPFPLTKVDLCYDDRAIHITFKAYDETNFFFNASQTTDGDIWAYEVMEAFIYKGTDDPRRYFEYEVSPNNVTFQAFIYNPSKVRAPGARFDGAFFRQPIEDGLTAATTLDRDCHTWVSDVRIPLGLFNVDDGAARGTQWRMNFFRIVTSPEIFPDQILAAWSPTDQANFHMSPFFGHVKFV